MTSERWTRGLAYRWFAVAVLAMLGSLVCASVAQAQVQTFFVVVPDTLQGEEREAYQECAERLNAALVNTGLFRANADAETQRTVSSCVGETASASAKRECELSIANVEVDWLLMLSSRRIGGDWKWGVAALSPAEGGAQKWGGDGSSVEADPGFSDLELRQGELNRSPRDLISRGLGACCTTNNRTLWRSALIMNWKTWQIEISVHVLPRSRTLPQAAGSQIYDEAPFPNRSSPCRVFGRLHGLLLGTG